MSKPQIPIAQAITAFQRTYAPDHAPKSGEMMRMHLARFQRECKKTLLQDLRHYDLNTFLGQWKGNPRRLRLTALRQFLRWAKRMYDMLDLPIPISESSAPYNPSHESVEREAEELMALARQAAERLVLPHQRAIFLCGFLYCMPLSRVHHAALEELSSLRPQRRDFYDLLAEVYRVVGWTPTPLFQTWLGFSLKTAQRRWLEWSGVRFQDIVRAGYVAYRQRGYRPPLGFQKFKRYDDPLRTIVTDETIRLMPTFWEEGR
ncbi:hypothetical protein LCGC14_2885630 [marine sediment metagenome]|uniref:Core-binding (CB) domain-containing protein n=1 Tax=marine sediment metagenome TaxID=412755 RepID=A0A0F9APW2_9ZZZZ